MNDVLLDNWKNSNLEGLLRRKEELNKSLSWHKFQVEMDRNELEVIWYYIAIREGEIQISDSAMEKKT